MSFSTRARPTTRSVSSRLNGMMTFLQQAPSAAPVVLDLIANSMDWPNADKFAERLKTLLPPNIQALEAQESGEAPPPPPPPDPEALIEQQKMQVEQQKLQVDQQKMQVDQLKIQADLKKAEMSLAEKQMELKAKGIEAFGGTNDAQNFGRPGGEYACWSCPRACRR